MADFKSKVMEYYHKDDGLDFYITENEAGVKIHYIERYRERVVDAEVIKRCDNGYTIAKAEGKTFDFLNNERDTKNNGLVGIIDEFYEMQETGDIVTKRKSQGTYALVSSGNDEKTNNGDRFQIDSQTYEEFKQAYLNYAKNMESYYNEESTKFSEHVNNFLDNGAFKFYDVDFLHSSENLKDKVNKKATYENINSNGDGYKIEKDIQHDVRFLTQFKDGKEKSYRILGHKARPGGYSMIRCEQSCYSDWLDSRISWISGKGNTNKGFQTGDKAPALGDDVNFLVSPEGGLFGITEKERDDLREKAIAIKLEREKKVSNEKNIQIEGVSKMKADILNRNLDMERI